MNMLENDTVCRSLSRSIARGDESMEDTPGLIRRVIQQNMWQERVLHETGEKIKFRRFVDFVEAPPLEGLGTTLEIIRALCKRNPDVLALIDQVTKKTLSPEGTNRYTSSDDVSSLDRSQLGSTGREYTAARLTRDGYTKLAEQVINREITAAEARRQVGWENKRRSIPMDDADSSAQIILKYMEPKVIEDLLQRLQQAITEKV